MATYRLSAQVIGRSSGRSATAAAAYRAGVTLYDERTGLLHDYQNRRDSVAHSEILAPDGAPEWVHDRQRYYTELEQKERRKDAQLVREILVSLPHELDDDRRQELVREFVRDEFVSRGMVADMSIHRPDPQGDQRNHHAHILLSLREMLPDGLAAKKNRQWNETKQLEEWREKWAEYQNNELEKAGIDARVTHLSNTREGIGYEPEPKLGAVATQMEREGRESHAGNDLRAVWQRNLEQAKLQDEAERIELQIAQEQAAQELQERRDALDELDTYQRTQLEQEAARHQERITELAAQLDERNRLQVLWDKLRGRTAWNAEKELETARMALEEAEERRRAFEVIQDTKEQQERDMEALQPEPEPQQIQTQYEPTGNDYAIPPPEQAQDIHTSATVTAAISEPEQGQAQETQQEQSTPFINDYMSEIEVQQQKNEQIERAARQFAEARDMGNEMGQSQGREHEPE